MKLLVDMNLSPLWADILSNAGWEAVHWAQTGPADASDEEITAFARRNGYAIFTHDLDFGAILAFSGGKAPSVVQIRGDDVIPDGMTAKVICAMRQTDLESGALLTIDPAKTRLRLLPLNEGVGGKMMRDE
jgi:predicted nuclease of predicted toxin-antitoxin system